MYQYSGIHNDLMEIKSELKKNDNEEKINELEHENFRLNLIINDLASLNKRILREIINKHYRFAVPIDKTDVRTYTGEDIESFETKIAYIPLDNKIIDIFNMELYSIFEKYKEFKED